MNHLMNPNVLDLTPYKPGKPVDEIKRKYGLDKVIKLASNENPLPLPANVVQAIQKEILSVNRYPDSDSYYLREKIAAYNNIDMKNIIIGSGSVEIIRMIIRCFLGPGETVLTSKKTFLLYRIATIETAGKDAFVEIEIDNDYRFNLDEMSRVMDEKTKIIFLTNPNNPTGTMLSKKEVHDFIDAVPEDKIIVLDNAYHEYVPDMADYADGIELATQRKNVIVLRTFSKIYGLAGFRIGYGIAHEETISFLGRVKAPFNVTRLAQVAALASLENDDFKNETLRVNAHNRDKLFRQLQELGLKPVPSVTNFIMFFPPVDIEILNERLLQDGIIIRPLQAFGVPDAMRVTVGIEEENDAFIEKLKKNLEEMK